MADEQSSNKQELDGTVAELLRMKAEMTGVEADITDQRAMTTALKEMLQADRDGTYPEEIEAAALAYFFKVGEAEQAGRQLDESELNRLLQVAKDRMRQLQAERARPPKEEDNSNTDARRAIRLLEKELEESEAETRAAYAAAIQKIRSLVAVKVERAEAAEPMKTELLEYVRLLEKARPIDQASILVHAAETVLDHDIAGVAKGEIRALAMYSDTRLLVLVFTQPLTWDSPIHEMRDDELRQRMTKVLQRIRKKEAEGPKTAPSMREWIEFLKAVLAEEVVSDR